MTPTETDFKEDPPCSRNIEFLSGTPELQDIYSLCTSVCSCRLWPGLLWLVCSPSPRCQLEWKAQKPAQRLLCGTAVSSGWLLSWVHCAFSRTSASVGSTAWSTPVRSNHGTKADWSTGCHWVKWIPHKCCLPPSSWSISVKDVRDKWLYYEHNMGWSTFQTAPLLDFFLFLGVFLLPSGCST